MLERHRAYSFRSGFQCADLGYDHTIYVEVRTGYKDCSADRSEQLALGREAGSGQAWLKAERTLAQLFESRTRRAWNGQRRGGEQKFSQLSCVRHEARDGG